MSDPYKVLNISPNATDEEVRHAYRELARKYHPDNYHDNPLADLAQEKMKEINEAYELVQRQRKSRVSDPQNGYSSYAYSGTAYRTTGGSNPLLQRVRTAIREGDITLAERLLNEARDHDAEWNFLMGVVCYRRGWMDDAKRYVQTACQMDSGNAEYSQMLRQLAGSGYQPAGFRGFGSMTYGDDACMRLCTGMACYGATGCPIFCCI